MQELCGKITIESKVENDLVTSMVATLEYWGCEGGDAAVAEMAAAGETAAV